MELKIILILIIVFIMVALAIQNPTSIVLTFFSWESPEVPLILVIIISMVIGLVIASLIGVLRQFRVNREIKRLEDTIERQNEELKSFRNQSILESEDNNNADTEGED